VSPKTAAHFGAGFAPKGIMRGRFAIPVHVSTGILLAYCGRAVKDESPVLLFQNVRAYLSMSLKLKGLLYGIWCWRS
jgi:hypothetical protein